jgi:hypothetical protein
MKRHPTLLTAWYTVNGLLAISVLLFLVAVGGDYSTREYLKGFSDAVTPAGATPEEKISEILAWMQHGPARRTGDASPSAIHDPSQTLNYQALLRVCGSATNAFVNLANSSGLQSRRLLLLNADRGAKHVVAEVYIDGRWIVVDPAFRNIPRGADGHLLTRQELSDPEVLRQATLNVPTYNPSYTYETTAHVRLARIPIIGRFLRDLLNHVLPGWEDSIWWTVLLERRSFALLVISFFLMLFFLFARVALRWYAEARYGIPRVRVRQRVRDAIRIVLGMPV